jgi:hypothetical protein
LIPKKFNFCSAETFFQFFVILTLDSYWIRIRIQPKMLDPDPDPYEMNTDPPPCLQEAALGWKAAPAVS